MLFERNGECVLHVHIPRTGGRTIVELFRANKWIMRDRKMANERVFGKDIEFLHASERDYVSRYGTGIESFAVVRNPVDRFLSASRILKPSLLVEEWTADYFESLFLRANATQWIRRQANFITAETKIWRYEDGLGEKFCEWMREECNIGIEYKGLLKYSRFSYDERPMCYNESLLKFVESYYSTDREELGYE